MTHRERMIERRQRQLARVPGFDPMPNARIDNAIAEALGMAFAMGLDSFDAMQFAWQRMVRSLPPLPHARRHRAPRASKGDLAAWRKSGSDIGLPEAMAA